MTPTVIDSVDALASPDSGHMNERRMSARPAPDECPAAAVARPSPSRRWHADQARPDALARAAIAAAATIPTSSPRRARTKTTHAPTASHSIPM